MKKLVFVVVFVLVLFFIPNAALAADIPLAAGGDLAAAVAGASSGDRIILEAGTYNLTSQLVIDKDISIVGAGESSTEIQIDWNSPSTAAADQGAIYVTAGNTLDISNLTLDGSGNTVFAGIYSDGNVNASNMVVSNIFWNTGSYYGFGMRLMGGTNNVTLVEMSNIYRVGCYVGNSTTYISYFTYHGKGDGDWLDYGIEVERGGTAYIDNAYIENCTGVASVDGSGSGGILATTFFNPGTTAHITNSEFVNNSVDIFVGYQTTDTTVVTISDSILSLGQKIQVSNPALAVDARNNYWGTNDMAAVIADLGNVNIDVDPIETRAASTQATNPQTGYKTNLFVYFLTAAVLLMGSIFAVITIRKKSNT